MPPLEVTCKPTRTWGWPRTTLGVHLGWPRDHPQVRSVEEIRNLHDWVVLVFRIVSEVVSIYLVNRSMFLNVE